MLLGFLVRNILKVYFLFLLFHYSVLWIPNPRWSHCGHCPKGGGEEPLDSIYSLRVEVKYL